MSDVDTFLAHFGVKGMKWGVRRSASSTSSGGSSTREDVKQAGIAVAKVAARYGAPPAAVAAASLAAPIGLPSVVALGVSAKILLDPDAQEAISAAGKFAKDWASDKQGDFEEWAADKKLWLKNDPEVYDQMKVATKGSGLPADKDGPMFNPDADISGGRVRDIGTRTDQINSGWDKQFEDDKLNLPW